MKYVLVALALIAAIVIVACSGATLFLIAFHSVSVPWQQWVAGVTIGMVVAWEAVALLVIGYCFRKWHLILGSGTALALVLAMAVTASMEWRNWISGRADVSIERSVKASDRDRVHNELERAYVRRDKLQSVDRLTRAQREELAEVKDRIATLEAQWDTRTVNIRASGNVEGEAIQDLIGWDARTTQIIIDTLPMWLMMLLRVISVPGAYVAIQAMRSEKPQNEPGAALAPEATVTPSASLPAVLRPRKDALATIAGVDVRNNIGQADGIAAEVSDKLAPNAVSVPEVGTDPDGPGTPIAKPEDPKEVAEEDPKVVRPAVWHEENSPPVAPRTNGKRQRNHLNRKDQTVIQWLSDCCSITDSDAHLATGQQCFASYKSYCDSRRIAEKDRVPQNRMSTVLSGQLGTRSGGRGKRNGKGAVFPGLMISQSAAFEAIRTKQKRVA